MYLYNFKETNPRSLTDFVTDVRGCFKYMHMALVASIKGYKYYKPIMVVDGTFLEGAHRGTLITTRTRSANENIFSLIFSIVDYEHNLVLNSFSETPQQNLEDVKICASSQIDIKVS